VDPPPVIIDVNGTGSIDGSDGHAPRHINNQLIIHGENLADANARLINSGGAVVELSSCKEPTYSKLQVALPADVAAGTYTLEVNNQAGSCAAEIRLLQGEAGSLDASASELVASINDALAADPDLKLAGTLPTNDLSSTITAVASATMLEARSIVVNGAEQVDDNSVAGLFLTVLDLSTHTIYEEGIGATLSTRMAFSADSEADRRGLMDVFKELSDTQVVVLASAGNITAMSQDALLTAELRDFGASNLLSTLGPDDAYVLIGTKGIGDGGGIEQVAGPQRSGVASVSSVALGPSVMGFRSRAADPSGLVGFFAGACPPGWSEYAEAQGRTLVGMPSGGTQGLTKGSALGDGGSRTIADVASHNHSVNPPATGSSSNGSHAHNIAQKALSSNSTGSHAHNMAQKQLNSGGAGGHAHTTPQKNLGTSSNGAHTHSYNTPEYGYYPTGRGFVTQGGQANGSGAMRAAGNHNHSVTVPAMNTSSVSDHIHSVTIPSANTNNAGNHSHSVTFPSTNTNTVGGHGHTTDIGSFSSGSAGQGTVDVTMPYLQLRVCRKD